MSEFPKSLDVAICEATCELVASAIAQGHTTEKEAKKFLINLSPGFATDRVFHEIFPNCFAIASGQSEVVKQDSNASIEDGLIKAAISAIESGCTTEEEAIKYLVTIVPDFAKDQIFLRDFPDAFGIAQARMMKEKEKKAEAK